MAGNHFRDQIIEGPITWQQLQAVKNSGEGLHKGLQFCQATKK